MTTGEAARAAQEDAATAEEVQIAETVAEAAGPSTDVAAEQARQVAPDVIQEVRGYLGREQGRIAQEFGQRGQQLQNTILTNVAEMISPLTQEIGQLRKTRLAEMEPEDRASYLEAENDQLRAVRAGSTEDSPSAVEETTQGANYSDAFKVVAGLARGMGVAVDITGQTNLAQAQQVWAGWREGMTQNEIVAVAEANLKKMAPARAPAAAAPSAPRVNPPPSTKGAPSAPQDSYASPSDLADAVVKGEINGIESRRIRREKQESGEWL